jgi:hypothetical protein
MPNHTANRLVLTGPIEQINALKELMRAKEADEDGKILAFDFNQIKPMPKELLDTVSGFMGDEEQQKALVEKQQANIEKFGYPTWYEFANEEWGTKWNAYGFHHGDWKDDNSLYFVTAWSPPIPIMVALSEKFPELEILLEFADEGGFFLGAATWKGGTQARQVEHKDWETTDAKAMLERLGRLQEEDEEENDEQTKQDPGTAN